eukprot:6515644-Prymnesium_polylepis.1
MGWAPPAGLPHTGRTPCECCASVSPAIYRRRATSEQLPPYHAGGGALGDSGSGSFPPSGADPPFTSPHVTPTAIRRGRAHVRAHPHPMPPVRAAALQLHCL